NLGAVMGVPVMATIVIETLKNELPRHLPAGSGPRLAKAATSGAQGLIAGQSQGLTEAFGKLPPAVAHQVLTAVRVSLATGIERAFLVGTALAALGLIATFFLPEIPLRGTIQDHPTGRAFQFPPPLCGRVRVAALQASMTSWLRASGSRPT